MPDISFYGPDNRYIISYGVSHHNNNHIYIRCKTERNWSGDMMFLTHTLISEVSLIFFSDRCITMLSGDVKNQV